MEMNKKKRKRTLFIVVTVIVVGIGSILYALANRYLIEHVEVVVPHENRTSSNAGENTASNASDTTNISTPSNAKYDDSSYTSDDIQIKINEVQTGSGNDQITYYVADVVLKDTNTLQSAFANDSFGRNIIEKTSAIAANNDAIFAINGDYYGFRDDGVIIRNGTVYRDTPVRTALALFKDGTMKSFDEKELSSTSLLASGVTNTYSFGPTLIKDGTVIDNFDHLKIDTNFGNRSIQNSNPRTGIGMIAPNHYVFIVVDGRMTGYSKGMTLSEFAKVFANLGCTEAYNLDGGGSSTMYFMGRVVNSPLGKNKERGVSDILYIREAN
ncbi:phosphodiester glycosidase family protein [Paenibacillus macquariensis]|uniref:Exopolysaccharide biosynthesis protein n=1 Tax=Paenibacillus macquariensis TaxID=948756 RepID=A0ABY1K635_9BACL|nr:phosphodiester glycosidase family protein [Paenibacillus macquariensis]MEC0090556.1 phosphodiester glycosidase family protein [Paenibacillus macquariensis]OAB38552.1 exopolysaccharide biosynthesis protein [Paenibacillus macquariensis subsp. macquariensis]SIR31107.1 Exopolysaccharide biosynthesis protein [Paenibacillus macquariensis]